VKAVERLYGAMKLLPDLRWVAAPGEGFAALPDVMKTGQLSNAQVREAMKMASGLVLCSRYEGNPLVVLEALAMGTPVVATRVGAIPLLPDGLQGLILADAGNPQALADAIRAASRLDPAKRKERTFINQSVLPTWERVADIYLDVVQSLVNARGRASG
jgi:glycosyltransferase involved in cell wall biosynthesis